MLVQAPPIDVNRLPRSRGWVGWSLAKIRTLTYRMGVFRDRQYICRAVARPDEHTLLIGLPSGGRRLGGRDACSGAEIRPPIGMKTGRAGWDPNRILKLVLERNSATKRAEMSLEKFTVALSPGGFSSPYDLDLQIL